jgi:hypothetical protein
VFVAHPEVVCHTDLDRRLPVMHPAGPRIVMLGALMLLGAAVSFLVEESWQSAPARPAAEFQRILGGLGLGPEREMSRCGFSFDPRVCNNCHHAFSSFPGCAWLCPYHAGAAVYLAPRQAAKLLPEMSPDANLP